MQCSPLPKYMNICEFIFQSNNNFLINNNNILNNYIFKNLVACKKQFIFEEDLLKLSMPKNNNHLSLFGLTTNVRKLDAVKDFDTIDLRVSSKLVFTLI